MDLKQTRGKEEPRSQLARRVDGPVAALQPGFPRGRQQGGAFHPGAGVGGRARGRHGRQAAAQRQRAARHRRGAGGERHCAGYPRFPRPGWRSPKNSSPSSGSAARSAAARSTWRAGSTCPRSRRQPSSLHATANNVLAARDDNVTARVNADVRVTGPLAAASVDGTVGLTKSRYLKDIDIVPINLPGKPAPAPPATAPAGDQGPGSIGVNAAPIKDWKLHLDIPHGRPVLRARQPRQRPGHGGPARARHGRAAVAGRQRHHHEPHRHVAFQPPGDQQRQHQFHAGPAAQPGESTSRAPRSSARIWSRCSSRAGRTIRK